MELKNKKGVKVLKEYYRDGAKVQITKVDTIKGRYVAIVNFKDTHIFLLSTFPTLLRAKVDVIIKKHYSAVIQSLAQTAREINANARKKSTFTR